jgi:hypothetical protein
MVKGDIETDAPFRSSLRFLNNPGGGGAWGTNHGIGQCSSTAQSLGYPVKGALSLSLTTQGCG